MANVRAVDGIFQVVREFAVAPARPVEFRRLTEEFYHYSGAFDDADVIHVEGDVDPIRDMEIIQQELQCVPPFPDTL